MIDTSGESQRVLKASEEMLCWHVTFKDHDNGRYTQRHAIHGKIVKRDPLLLSGTSARENPPNTGKVIIDGSGAQGWRTIKLPNGIAEARIILSEEDSRELLVTMIKDECIAIKTNPLLCSRQAEIKVGFQTTQNPACLLYTSPSPRDGLLSRMPSSA